MEKRVNENKEKGKLGKFLKRMTKYQEAYEKQLQIKKSERGDMQEKEGERKKCLVKKIFTHI